MKKNLPGFSLLVLIMALGLSVSAQEDSAGSNEAERARKQKEIMQATLPGEEHELLARLAGDWNMELKMWMTPETEPMIVSGTSRNEMILGGRFLKSEAAAGSGAHAMESLNLVGFDRRHKKYTTVGFDNFGTYSVSASGSFDEESGKLVLSGTGTDPIGGFDQVYDFVVEFIDDDHYRWSVIFKNKEMTHGQPEFKMVEIVYTRES